jgi:diamine N-acetyltransferase
VPCSIDDVETLRQVAYETYDQTFRPLNTTRTIEKYLEEAFNREKLLEELSNPKSNFFFLYADEELSGYLKVNEAPAQSDLNDPDSLELERIYVRKESQGKGLGKVLITYAIQIAGERAKQYVWLGVWERNINAIAFYKKMGFTVAGTHTFRMGDEIQQDLIMKKVLEERK